MLGRREEEAPLRCTHCLRNNVFFRRGGRESRKQWCIRDNSLGEDGQSVSSVTSTEGSKFNSPAAPFSVLPRSAGRQAGRQASRQAGLACAALPFPTLPSPPIPSYDRE